MVKLNIIFTNLFTNILLCLSLYHLKVKSNLRLEYSLFSKQTNKNKSLFELSSNYL